MHGRSRSRSRRGVQWSSVCRQFLTRIRSCCERICVQWAMRASFRGDSPSGGPRRGALLRRGNLRWTCDSGWCGARASRFRRDRRIRLVRVGGARWVMRDDRASVLRTDAIPHRRQARQDREHRAARIDVRPERIQRSHVHRDGAHLSRAEPDRTAVRRPGGNRHDGVVPAEPRRVRARDATRWGRA